MDAPHRPPPHEPASSRPSRLASAALGVALASLALAVYGAVALSADETGGLGAHGALAVAVGGAILGVTLAAVGLLVTRPPDDHDPPGRRRAWLAGAISLPLLVVLVLALAYGPGASPRIDDEAAAQGPGGAALRAVEPDDPPDVRAVEPEDLPDATQGVVPVPMAEAPAEAWARAERAARDLGWQIRAADAEARTLEVRAPDAATWIHVRVRETPEGSMVELHPARGDDRPAGAGHLRALADRLTSG